MAANASYVTMTLNLNSTIDGQGGGGNGTRPEGGSLETLIKFYEHNTPVAVMIDRLITPIFYLIGIPCNPLCAYIWLGRHTRRSNSSAIYLGALSVSHTVFLVLHIFVNELNYAWGIKTFDGYVSCELFYTAYYCPQYLAPLLVLGFTVERYIAVCYPFVKEKYCTVRRAVLVVLVLLASCFLLSCVQAYLWTFDESYQVCNHREFLQSSDFPRLWTWVTELVIFGIAPLAALVFNVLVIREIRSINSRGPAVVTSIGSVGGGGGGGASGGSSNQASTVTLLSVSFYLICTWLPATLLYSIEREFPIAEDMSPKNAEVWERHFTYYTVRKVVEEVTLSNSACYFFIYYLTGKYFRTRFKQIMCPRRCTARNEANGSVNGRTMTSRQYIAVPCRMDNGHSMSATNV